MTFYSYDPAGEGFRFHYTAEEAQRAAEKALEVERQEAEDYGWPDHITDVSWGQVSGSAQKRLDESNDYELRG